MTQQIWDLYAIKVEEIVEHLVEHHSVSFDSRMSLSVDEFISEHFPELLKDLEERDLVFDGAENRRVKGHYLSEKGKERLRKARSLLGGVLKYCEENSIPIAKVLDEVKNEAGLRGWEWRICKPNYEQITMMKFTRWFACAEGYFNKALSQEGMLDDLSEKDLELLIKQLRDTIKIKRKEREIKIEKKKKKIEIATDEDGDEKSK